jgi:hypothetical protein
MYVAARQTSQGAQRAYTVRHTPDDDDTNFIDNSNYVNNNNTIWLQRGSLSNNNDHDELDHELSDFSEAPYVTPTSAGLMRDISCGSEIEEP